jgi:hypothetical protein
MRIAADYTRPAFDFHEEKPAGAEYQRVYLVDLAVIIDEFKVRPSMPRITIGKFRPQPVERLALPRKLRFRYRRPSWRTHWHLSALLYSHESVTPQFSPRCISVPFVRGRYTPVGFGTV